MADQLRRRRRGPRLAKRLGIGLGVGLVAAAGMTAAAVLPAAAAGGAGHSGSVDVLYAGSLVDLMQQQLGPAFHAATGYTVDGVAAGSQELAAEIKGRTQQADVFISAAPAVDRSLEGAANGSWVSWYSTFASSPLVLGYDPHSRFAHALATEPWWKVVTSKGFLLGWTDPATDPKGVLAVKAMDEAARAHHAAALEAMAASTGTEFPEQTLVGRLQSGQLDAGFFYDVEAKAAKLHTVRLRGIDLSGDYTVTVVAGAPHAAAAESFVAFLLGRHGRRILAENGVTVAHRLAVTGDLKAVPAKLRRVFGDR
ncbi:MAG: substrate-binding domain-containing protein [Acidimicrobiales bacterium]